MVVQLCFGAEVGLGNSPRVVFKIPVPEGVKWFDHHDYIEVRLEDGVLVLHGGAQLVVVPTVTNVLRVELRQR